MTRCIYKSIKLFLYDEEEAVYVGRRRKLLLLYRKLASYVFSVLNVLCKSHFGTTKYVRIVTPFVIHLQRDN